MKQLAGPPDVQAAPRDPYPTCEWLAGNLKLSDWLMGQYHVLLDGGQANRRVQRSGIALQLSSDSS